MSEEECAEAGFLHPHKTLHLRTLPSSTEYFTPNQLLTTAYWYEVTMPCMKQIESQSAETKFRTLVWAKIAVTHSLIGYMNNIFI